MSRRFLEVLFDEITFGVVVEVLSVKDRCCGDKKKGDHIITHRSYFGVKYSSALEKQKSF
jgi:hypothetical protein